jgi:hypothetical protein
MKSRLLVFIAISLAAAATGCGTGFVDGWRDEPAAPKPRPSLDLTDVTDEAQCKLVENAGWFDGKCVAYADASEAQCATIAAWAWYDAKCRPASEVECLSAGRAYVNGQCLDRPTLTAEGNLDQTTVAGFSIAPITLNVTPGSAAKLSGETCAGFYKIVAGKLQSTDGTELDVDVKSCSVTVTATNQFAASDPLTVVTTFKDGFYRICSSGGQNETVRVLRNKLRGDDGDRSCATITKKLVAAKTLEIEPLGLTDLKPLAGLRNLEDLIISANGVRDISVLADFSNLKYLDIAHNRVTDLRPIAGLSELVTLYAAGNDLDVADAERCPKDAASPAVAQFCAAAND